MSPPPPRGMEPSSRRWPGRSWEVPGVGIQLREAQFSSESSWLPTVTCSRASGLSVMLGSLEHCRCGGEKLGGRSRHLSSLPGSSPRPECIMVAIASSWMSEWALATVCRRTLPHFSR